MDIDKLKKMAAELAEQAKDKASELALKAGPVAGQAKQKAGELAKKAGPATARGVDKAAGSIDKATGGKYTDKIGTVNTKVGGVLDRGGASQPATDATAATEVPTPEMPPARPTPVPEPQPDASDLTGPTDEQSSSAS